MKRFLFLAGLALLVLPLACSDDQAAESGASAGSGESGGLSSASSRSAAVPAGVAAFNDHVRALPRLEQPSALTNPEALAPAVTNWSDEEYTVIGRFRAAPEFVEVLALDPTSDVIWPGAVLHGPSVPSGDYIPVAGARAPLAISISLENIQGNRAVTVADPKLSTVRQAIGDMLAQTITGSTPARVSFSIGDIHSAAQLELAVGASFGGGGNMVKAQFDFANQATRSRVLVKFVQVYYTLDIDLPATPAALFSAASDWGALARSLTGAAPLYVATISYGRMAFFSFESTVDSTRLKAAVSASCQAIIAGGEATVSPGYRTILSNTSINATIVGGNGATAVNAVRGFDGLKLHLLAGGNFDRNSPAAPLAYKLRYLSDNTPGRFVLVGEYETRTVCRAYDWYRVRDVRLFCDAEDDPGDEAEFFGTCDITAMTNGAAVEPWSGNAPATERFWDVPLVDAEQWALVAGNGKVIPGTRRFRIRQPDLAAAVLRVRGHLKEEDLPYYDDLDEQERTVRLADLPADCVWLPQFVDGGTRARIGFVVEREDP